MSSEWEDFHLSDLKFTGIIPTSQSTPNANTTNVEPSPTYSRKIIDMSTTGFSRPKPHERLAADHINEELAPDAGIWQLYLEEAKEHDEELVNGQNKNLDMMLLFAALFSSILTAFLIESKNMLQQDPSEASIALLLLVARSQQRMEQGHRQSTLPPIQLPSFSASMSARWINGLWFLALALSLSAALIAMLSKEWLSAYSMSRPRPAHTHALLRQARLAGLIEWRALHIIDLLPTMLHLALLLFALGLILYLSNYDSAIAIVVAIVTGATLSFYVVTVLLGAIYEFCPFVTQISKYAHKGLTVYFKDCIVWKGNLSAQDKQLDDYTTDEVLRALAWLADNARDPAVGDCAYQALAGLRFNMSLCGTCGEAGNPSVAPTAQGGARGTIPAPHVDKNTISPHEDHIDVPNQYELVSSLFNLVCKRLSTASTHQPQELAACQGINVARYANALPRMVHFLGAYSDQKLGEMVQHETNTLSAYRTPAQTAISALDTVWSNEYPSLSPDAYALLTSAELQLTEVIVKHTFPIGQSLYVRPGATNTGASSPSHISSEQDDADIEGHAEINMNTRATPQINFQVPLFDLRARYSRALSRAAYQLHYHVDGRAPIGANALLHLLESIGSTARCDGLNEESQLSTHQPQSLKGPAPTIEVRVIGMGDYLIVDPNGIGDEDALLVGLLRLLASADVQTNTGLENAAIDALNTIAPILLKQWLNMIRSDQAYTGFQTERTSESILAVWSQLTRSVESDLKVDRPACQALAIAAITVPYAEHPGIEELPETSIYVLYKRLTTDPNRLRAYASFYILRDVIGQLVHLIDQHLLKHHQLALNFLLDLFLAGYQNRSFFRDPGIPIDKIPAFLRILARVSGRASAIQTLLDDLAYYFRRNTLCLWKFTESGEGFNALKEIGEHVDYQLAVAKCLRHVLETATDNNSTIPMRAVPELLDVVDAALKALPPDNEDADVIVASMCRALPPLSSLPGDITHIVASHPAVAAIFPTLKKMAKSSEAQATLLAEVEEMQSWAYADSLPSEGLAVFFELESEAL